MVETGYQVAMERGQGTFKVETRRHDKKFPLVSDQINRAVATKILKESEMRVDVHNPDLRIGIEVREEFTYVMADTIKGAGGYPVGMGGKALLMLSGGIDSPVAGYLTMKRGVEIECIHYASPPYTSSSAQKKVLDLAGIISKYQGSIKVQYHSIYRSAAGDLQALRRKLRHHDHAPHDVPDCRAGCAEIQMPGDRERRKHRAGRFTDAGKHADDQSRYRHAG